jgi:dihydropyrimidinase
VTRVLALAEVAQAPVYIVHVSTRRGAEAIINAQARGQAAYGETCPQYLLLNDDGYSAPGFEGAKYICSPPLRKPGDQAVLWQALTNGQLQSIGTDHCPFYYHGMKDLGRPVDDRPAFTEIPGGLPGIEARLALIYTYGVGAGRLTLQDWVDRCSTGPARMFGLYPRKGALQVGSDADIVLFDPHKKVTLSTDILHENVDYTPYQGFELQGFPVMTILRGQVIVRDGEYCNSEPFGKFIHRNFTEART